MNDGERAYLDEHIARAREAYAARDGEAMEAAGIVSTPEHNGDRTVLAPPPPPR